jgi:hypothetical protein
MIDGRSVKGLIRTCEHCGAVRPNLGTQRHFCSRECFVAAKTVSIADRFWPKVNKRGPKDPNTGTRCWVWTKSLNNTGYGQFWIPGRPPWKAHRVAWELTHGPIKPEINILHRCDRPSCVNPDHLFTGTLADNNRDMWDKGRARGPAVLTADIVREIRSKPWMSQHQLAIAYGVSQANIQAILSRRTWKHVE